jgi:predicted DNA-binding transcriptional regulator AlpA
MIEVERAGCAQCTAAGHRKNHMKFLRIGQVMQLTGLSRMTIYRLELAGEFPKRRRLSKNSVAWLDTDIAQWAESRPISPLRGTSGTTSGSGGAAYG